MSQPYCIYGYHFIFNTTQALRIFSGYTTSAKSSMHQMYFGMQVAFCDVFKSTFIKHEARLAQHEVIRSDASQAWLTTYKV